MKPKPEPRPITAQVPDHCAGYGVNSRGKEHYDKHDHEMKSDNQLQQAAGCYRRTPTCED